MASIAPTGIEIIAAIFFALAVIHTFSTRFVAQAATRYPDHAGLFHWLGEVEVVFGLWALALMAALLAQSGGTAALAYLDSRSFTEPIFVLVIMVIAASRPILNAVLAIVQGLARRLPMPTYQGAYFLCLSAVPLFGSFITEPAAMTLAAILLRDAYFVRRLSPALQYTTLGVLFVNVSIGGTLTHFAAPPVLMVAAKWQWDAMFMLTNFGWKATIAVGFNAAVATWLFRRELAVKADAGPSAEAHNAVPWQVTAVHLLFLVGVVVFAHHPPVFVALFLFFLGFTEAYKRHQSPLCLREGVLVAFFLAGLVVLGGLQQWWLQLALVGVEPTPLYYIATALTAITDNAALTYLGSLVPGLTPEFKYALVAGAVTGGGLTVIANAPNPAGAAILQGYFRDASINPLRLFSAALPPTCVAILAFQCL